MVFAEEDNASSFPSQAMDIFNGVQEDKKQPSIIY